MPTFKIKDLMINLGDKVELQCAHFTLRTVTTVCKIVCHTGVTRICPPLTHCGCPTNFGWSYPTPTFTFTEPTTPYTVDVSIPEDIATLREQLKQQLAMLDQQEQVMNEQLQPQSLADAEMIEKKLKESLEEIQKIKEGFKKR